MQRTAPPRGARAPPASRAHRGSRAPPPAQLPRAQRPPCTKTTGASASPHLRTHARTRGVGCGMATRIAVARSTRAFRGQTDVTRTARNARRHGSGGRQYHHHHHPTCVCVRTCVRTCGLAHISAISAEVAYRHCRGCDESRAGEDRVGFDSLSVASECRSFLPSLIVANE